MEKIHLSFIDSTNAYLKNNYKELNNYTFVSTDEQSDGRGRNNRQWKSENGKNLLFSLLILDKELIKHYKEISIISAYSIIEELKELGLKDISIKWPNDVFVKDNKICGILLESVTKNEMECLIVGIGLNVNQIDFNGEYIVEPSSIKKIINKDSDINLLKDRIYQRLIDNLEKLKEEYNFYSFIKELDYLKNKRVYADINGCIKQVTVKGISEDYSLSIYNNDSLENIESGEISFHI